MIVLVTGCSGNRPEVQMTNNAPSITAPSITVTSAEFADGQAIPRRFSCDGPGDVPALSWHGTPADAAALALVVDDPDAPRGTFTHWVVLDLPPTAQELRDGTLPAGATEAINSGGRSGWYPPCPPSGTHHYRFTVYALARATGLPDRTPLDVALHAIESQTLAWGRLVGTYAR
jgi:Raf kinase inhibitor-like YbhB/YbcL family protein